MGHAHPRGRGKALTSPRAPGCEALWARQGLRRGKHRGPGGSEGRCAICFPHSPRRRSPDLAWTLGTTALSVRNTQARGEFYKNLSEPNRDDAREQDLHRLRHGSQDTAVCSLVYALGAEEGSQEDGVTVGGSEVGTRLQERPHAEVLSGGVTLEHKHFLIY